MGAHGRVAGSRRQPIGAVVILSVLAALAVVVIVFAFNRSGKPTAGTNPILPTGGPLAAGVPGVPATPDQPSATPLAGRPSPSGASSPTPPRTTAPSPTRQPPSASPPGGRALSPSGPPAPLIQATTVSAEYSVSSQWDSGFVAMVEVRNSGPQSQLWTVEMTFTADVAIADPWNATMQRNGSTYRFTPSGSSALRAGDSVRFGYLARRDGGSSRPSRCVVNGVSCR